MNPFTRAILKRIKDRRMSDFVRHWDALEALVIRVYKTGEASTEDEADHRRVREWLQKNYPRWQSELDPHWRSARIAGELATEDPFAYLIARSSAAEFAGDWRAMQSLPAAREALNEYLISLG